MKLGTFECKENNAVYVKGMMPGWFLATVCCRAIMIWSNEHESCTTKRA